MSGTVEFPTSPGEMIQDYTVRSKVEPDGDMVWEQQELRVHGKGRVLNLVVAGVVKAFIVQDFDDMSCQAFKISDDPNEEPQCLSPNNVSFDTALILLKESLS